MIQRPFNSIRALFRLGIIIATCIVSCLHLVSSTEETCRSDCSSSPRPVGPTRPWNSSDALRNSLLFTRPYPHYIAAAEVEEKKYDLYQFCKSGCNYFFVSSGADEWLPSSAGVRHSTLARCIDKCDKRYSYNITIGYSDLIEIARLECRDGCQMALRRCTPGYFCKQVSFKDEVSNSFQGGDMVPCPRGTYRDISYDAVTECLPCPPNHYREDIKGRSLAACSGCPAGTSAIAVGSTSILDCVRCPAGTFSTEASYCICITPKSCKGRVPTTL